ncbi:trans-aconitate methyltransferase 1 [Coemansia sp. RSA 1933]|nr:trans-aconitate methyltransferase 1 [Coemansia sp. RSA 1933]
MPLKTTPIYEAGSYQSSRPTYNPALAGSIVTFHKKSNSNAQTRLAVDVATGTGIFARELPSYFTKVIGVDISSEMLDQARAKEGPTSGIQYVQSSAESLAFLEDRSVDLITVATAVHWFDIPAFLAEANRVLKPTGTLALFTYTGLGRFREYPQCDEILRDFTMGDDKLGPYWEEASRITADGYVELHKQMAKGGWTGIKRSSFPCVLEPAPSQLYPVQVDQEAMVMNFKVSWRRFHQFLATASPLKRYIKDHPNEDSLCDKVIDELMLAAGVTDVDQELKFDWEQALVLGHPPPPASE